MALGAVIEVVSGNSVAAMGRVSSAFNSASQSAARAAAGGFRMLGGALTTLSLPVAGVAAGLLGTGAAGLKLAADFQATRIAFETMLGSAEAADEFLGQLRNFAATTPFEMTDLLTASRRMMALGFATKDVIPLMTSIGNATAAMSGGPEMMGRIVLALGQMKAKTRASTEEMNQLIETGVFGWSDLARHIGKTEAETMEMVTNKQVSAQTAIDAFVAHSAERFGGLMEKQSHTLLGQLSNMKDKAVQTMTDAFLPVTVALQPALDMINGVSAGLSDDKVQAFGKGMSEGVRMITEGMAQIRDMATTFSGGFGSGTVGSVNQIAQGLGLAAVAITVAAVVAAPLLAILGAAALAVGALGEALVPVAGIIGLGIVGALGIMFAAFAAGQGTVQGTIDVLRGYWNLLVVSFQAGREAFFQALGPLDSFYIGVGLLKAAWLDVMGAFAAGTVGIGGDMKGLAAGAGVILGGLSKVAIFAFQMGATMIRLGALILRYVVAPLSNFARNIPKVMIGVGVGITRAISTVVDGAKWLADNPIVRWALGKLGVDLNAQFAEETPAVPDMGESYDNLVEDILGPVSEQQAAVVAPDVPKPDPPKINQTINTSVQVDGKEIARSSKKSEVELTERAGFSITPWQRRQLLEQGATVLPTQ